MSTGSTEVAKTAQKNSKYSRPCSSDLLVPSWPAPRPSRSPRTLPPPAREPVQALRPGRAGPEVGDARIPLGWAQLRAGKRDKNMHLFLYTQ